MAACSKLESFSKKLSESETLAKREGRTPQVSSLGLAQLSGTRETRYLALDRFITCAIDGEEKAVFAVGRSP